MPSAKRKPLKMTRTEAEVLAQILEAAQMLGIDLDRQNTGAFANPKGQMVRCGKPGNADTTGQVPRGPNAGARIEIEAKAEGFDPNKLRGEKKAHFDRQLARLQQTNANGGIGFWCDDVSEFMDIMRHVLNGALVEEPGYSALTVYYPERSEA
jgi:hypothetical protein